MRVLQADVSDRASHPSIAATANSDAVTGAHRLQSSAAKKQTSRLQGRAIAHAALGIYTQGAFESFCF